MELNTWADNYSLKDQEERKIDKRMTISNKDHQDKLLMNPQLSLLETSVSNLMKTLSGTSLHHAEQLRMSELNTEKMAEYNIIYYFL